MIDNAIEGGTGARTRFETSWLIVRDDLGAGGGPPEVLTLGSEVDERILPVFSFEEEALLFLRFCGFGGGWHASKSRIADLASVLSDACPDVRRVALIRSPRSAPMGRTTSSACRERSSSGCWPPGDDAAHGPPCRRLRRVSLTPAGRTEPKSNGASLPKASPT